MKFRRVLPLWVWLFLPVFSWASCDVVDKTVPVYGKTVLVTGFPFLQVQQARWGSVQGMEVRLSQLIADEVNRRSTHRALDFSHIQVRGNSLGHQYYADQYPRSGVRWEALDLPDSQFVLTGVIENVAASQDTFWSWPTRYGRRALGLMDARYLQPRRLAMVVELINRYTGETVWRHRYVHQGNWNLKSRDRITVDNPRFWQSPYGQELVVTLDQLVEDVQAALDCESYMARVAEVTEQGFFIRANNKTNIQLGDYFDMAKLGDSGPYLPAAASRLSVVFARARVTGVTPFGVRARLLPENRGQVKVGDLVMVKQG